jgi:ornithine cyclodeaminase
VNAPLVLDADVARCLPSCYTVEVITAALVSRLDPAADLPRHAVALRAGQLLLMPWEGSRSGAHVGIKVVVVAPGNPARDLPPI